MNIPNQNSPKDLNITNSPIKANRNNGETSLDQLIKENESL